MRPAGAFSFETFMLAPLKAKTILLRRAQKITLWARNATVMPGDRGIPFRTSGLHILSWREAAQTFSAREPATTSSGADIQTTKAQLYS
jgi:hypothetical protein